METLVCDVIGCGRPAVWGRVGKAESRREDLLCQACWMQLCRIKPREAIGYVPYDRETSADPPASNAVDTEMDGDDVIFIGA